MADLSHGWGIAVGFDGFLDDIQDQLLAGGEAIVIGRAIWQLRDGCWCYWRKGIFLAHRLRVGERGEKVEHMFEIFLPMSVGICNLLFRTGVRIPSNAV